MLCGDLTKILFWVISKLWNITTNGHMLSDCLIIVGWTLNSWNSELDSRVWIKITFVFLIRWKTAIYNIVFNGAHIAEVEEL